MPVTTPAKPTISTTPVTSTTPTKPVAAAAPTTPSYASVNDPGVGNLTGTPGQAPDPNSLNALISLLLSGQSPDTSGQIANIQDQGDISQLSLGLDQQTLNQQLQSGLGQLGIQQGQLGISNAALLRQMGLLPQEQGLANQSFAQQLAQLQFNLKNNLQSQRGGAAASGAINTPGNKQALTNLRQNEAWGEATVNRSKQQSDLSYTEKAAELQDSAKNNQLTAKQIGISTADLKARIDTALQKLGLQGKLTADQVTQAIQTIQNGGISNLGSILAPIISAITGG